jgi:CheY-like chemotaxis protein
MAGVMLEVLFVPRKAETVSMIRRAAEHMDLNFQICNDAEEAERLLFCHRYDGLILDHDESTESVLRALRQSPSSRTAIAIDVHEEDVNLQTIFALGANFEIVTPLRVDQARRTLQLANGLMMLGRRRYYRHPVEVPARVVTEGRELDAVLSNVSEQGIGLRCGSMAWQSGPLQCSFDLPDHSGRVVMEATVVWADKTGQAGCRVEAVSDGREQFMAWLSRLFHQQTAGYAGTIHEHARHTEPLPDANA